MHTPLKVIGSIFWYKQKGKKNVLKENKFNEKFADVLFLISKDPIRWSVACIKYLSKLECPLIY